MMKKFVSKLLCGVTALLAISAAHAGAIDDAVKRGTLKVGMDPTYMPFEMTNKRGQIIGFEVDLLKAMAKSMGVKLELVSTGYDGIIPALMTNKFDMIGSGMTLTQERNLRLNFSEPFIVVGQTVLIRKELEDKIIRRLTQLGFAEDSNGVYRFLPPMHRFLDVCLSVQHDRDLAASLHSSDLPLPAPVLLDDDGDADPLAVVDAEESEEDALARAMAEERAAQEMDA